MNRVWMQTGAVAWLAAAAVQADSLVTYTFVASEVTNNVTPITATTVNSSLVSGGMLIDGVISLSVTNQPWFQNASLVIKDNDLVNDTSIDNNVNDSWHHGVTFALTPAVPGEQITVTNVALRFFSGATLSWTAGVFARAGSGSEVKLGEAAFTNLLTTDPEPNHWFAFNATNLVAAAGETVTVRLDFGDNNGLGANYTLFLDTVQVDGTVTQGRRVRLFMVN